MLKLIRKGVNAKYSPPAWILALMSLTAGVLLTLIAYFDPGSATVFLSALPLEGKLLGPVTMLASLGAIYGMGAKRPRWVKFASFASFLCWVFMAIAFFVDGGFVSLFLFPVWMLVFWGYKYLASWVREKDGV